MYVYSEFNKTTEVNENPPLSEAQWDTSNISSSPQISEIQSEIESDKEPELIPNRSREEGEN